MKEVKLYLPDEVLLTVEKPGRYIGGELNSYVKEPENVDIHMALCFADSYEIGMSHLGFKMLYELLNLRKDTWCERCFAPWPDLEKIMRDSGMHLFALESQQEVRKLDMLAFSLQYEMSYTNVINMLDLAGIPIWARDRHDGDPLIFAGGPAANNTEPISDFFDFFNLGEGEEMLGEIMDTFKLAKQQKLSRADTLKMLSKIEGVWVPSFYEPVYDESGRQIDLQIKDEFKDIAPTKVQKRIVDDFETSFFPEKMLVPNIAVVHDRIMLEIFRGCIRSCRFCQAGFIYRPVRERSPERLRELTEKLIKNTGYEEVSMLSLATSDYCQLEKLTDMLLDVTEQKHVSLAVPSLRADSFSLDLLTKISKVRKSGLTFAPEAGSQRLRDIINKGVSEESILNACRIAFEGGYNNVKLYFMLGLPFETDDDLVGIADLAHKVLGLYDEVHFGHKARRPEITVSISTFVPKPFTPFQWAPQIDIPEIKRRQEVVRNALSKRVNLSYHDPETSSLEGSISRGDRRISQVIFKAWEKGERFSAWSEFLHFDKWMEAFTDAKVDFADTHKGFEVEDFLPWQHVDIGVSDAFMRKEYEKARLAELTPNCRIKCASCGMAKFKRGVCVEGGKCHD